MDWSDPIALLKMLEPQALAVTVVLIVLMHWVFFKSLWRCRGLQVLPFAMGVLCFLPSIAYLQVPFQAWVTSLAMANLATANPLVLGLPMTLVSGFVQEGVKQEASRLSHALAGNRLSHWETGVLTGLGFGGLEAWLILSAAFMWAPSVYHVVPAFLERLAIVPFHASLGAFVYAAWGRGPVSGLASLCLGGLIHSIVNYGVVLYQAGLVGLGTLYIYLFSVSALTTLYSACLRRDSKR